MSTGDLPLRPGVGAILLNDRREVFIGQRTDSRGPAWQMPQGGIDADEPPAIAVRRELTEEIGTSRFRMITESAGWYDYDLPPELVGTVWGGRYRGQSQKWYAFHFLGSDADIDLAAHEAEFSAWQWLAADRLTDLIVPFKRDLYRAVLAEFAPILTGRVS